MSKRIFTFSEDLVQAADNYLKQNFETSIESSKKIAQSAMQLSDFYIENPTAPTPWEKSWCQIAYVGYYLHLNTIRTQAVLDQVAHLPLLNKVHNIIDFGSGLGTINWNIKTKNYFFIEQSLQAQKIHQSLGAKGTFQKNIGEVPASSMAYFSYSLTELKKLPEWSYECDNILVIEPATSQDGRALLKVRQQLIEKGYHILAPCTHQLSCPLLAESKYDWCHDRIHIERPQWVLNIEAQMPIKNENITFSYLVASKNIKNNENKARLVGDVVPEKGKYRQLICRGEKREFLTWMNRDWPDGPTDMNRGDLFSIPESHKIVSNEIRILK